MPGVHALVMNAWAHFICLAAAAATATGTAPAAELAIHHGAPVNGFGSGQDYVVLAQAGPSKAPTAAKTDSLSPAGLPQALKTDRGGASTGPDSGSILATRLVGQQAFSTTGEALGRVSDIAFSQTLKAEAAIIALTGTLGLRTKEVMVPASALSLEMTPEGTPRLTVAWSPEQIAAAPAFDRSALMR